MFSRVAATTTLVLLLGASAARASCGWSWLTTVGYGAAGLGAPWVISSPSWPPVSTLAVSTGAGIAVGQIAGRRACADLAAGKRLSGAQKTVIRLAAVLTGAGIGAAVAGMTTSGTNDPGEASDEAVLQRDILIGAAGGILAQYLLERGSPLATRFRLGPTQDGLTVSARFSF